MKPFYAVWDTLLDEEVCYTRDYHEPAVLIEAGHRNFIHYRHKTMLVTEHRRFVVKPIEGPIFTD